MLYCEIAMNLKGGNGMTPFVAEIVGTAILLFLGISSCAGTALKKSFAHQAGWMAVNFPWGLAVMIAIYAVGKYSGAHLNPVVTLSFAFIGKFPWAQVPSYITAQLLGAFIGATATYLQYLPHWKETRDSKVKLGVFATCPAIPHPFANLICEMLGSFVLILALLSIGANKFTDGLNPLIVGLLIFCLSMSVGGTTGAALNPARDFAPRLAHTLLPIPGKKGSNWPYAWIPIVGPILGGCLGGLFYQAFFLGRPSPQLWYVLGLSVMALVTAHLFTRKKRALPIKGTKKAA